MNNAHGYDDTVIWYIIRRQSHLVWKWLCTGRNVFDVSTGVQVRIGSMLKDKKNRELFFFTTDILPTTSILLWLWLLWFRVNDYWLLHEICTWSVWRTYVLSAWMCLDRFGEYVRKEEKGAKSFNHKSVLHYHPKRMSGKECLCLTRSGWSSRSYI